MRESWKSKHCRVEIAFGGRIEIAFGGRVEIALEAGSIEFGGRFEIEIARIGFVDLSWKLSCVDLKALPKLRNES